MSDRPLPEDVESAVRKLVEEHGYEVEKLELRTKPQESFIDVLTAMYRSEPQPVNETTVLMAIRSWMREIGADALIASRDGLRPARLEPHADGTWDKVVFLDG